MRARCAGVGIEGGIGQGGEEKRKQEGEIESEREVGKGWETSRKGETGVLSLPFIMGEE